MIAGRMAKISDEEAAEWKLRFSGGQSAEANQDI